MPRDEQNRYYPATYASYEANRQHKRRIDNARNQKNAAAKALLSQEHAELRQRLQDLEELKLKEGTQQEDEQHAPATEASLVP